MKAPIFTALLGLSVSLMAISSAKATPAHCFDIQADVLVKYICNDVHVKIPEGITSIGSRAFYDNYLMSVEIPESVTSIGRAAFATNNLMSVDIPKSVTSIGDYAFGETNSHLW